MMEYAIWENGEDMDLLPQHMPAVKAMLDAHIIYPCRPSFDNCGDDDFIVYHIDADHTWDDVDFVLALYAEAA